MIPHIATRGHSFKGAGQYYLHDKQTESMAYSDMEAKRQREEAGGAGRK
jgi:hypothetical protein